MGGRRLGCGLFVVLTACAAASGDSALPEVPASRSWAGVTERADGLWSHTDPGEIPTATDVTGAALLLTQTAVEATLNGHVAEVRVTQTFRNEAADATEVLYAFPLPENAAVSHMRGVVGERVIESQIMKRERGRTTRDDAKADGFATAPVEPERANLFTQSFPNVPSGQEIEIEIEYLQTLTYDAGTYEFVFPMVLGPRDDQGTTPEADRVSPPIIGKGMRRGDDFEIQVTARTGYPIERWWAPTHEVDAKVVGDVLQVELAEADMRPNRDFVLRYAVAGPKPRATMLLGPKDSSGQGHYALVVHPPDLDVDALVGRREFVFVTDRSGSRFGERLALAKDMVRQQLTHLRPVDTFDVVDLGLGTQRLFDSPRPANATNLAKALRFIDRPEPDGGTEMGGALQAALSDDVEAGRHRYVFILTASRISFEDEIVRAARSFTHGIMTRGQHARVFGAAVGAIPNADLIGPVSRAGMGVGLLVFSTNESHSAVRTFTQWVDHAIVDELQLHSGGLSLTGRHPKDLGSLFVSHAAVVYGEYSGDASTAVPHLSGSSKAGPVSIPIRVLDGSEGGDALDVLWARAAVADLQPRWWAYPSDETRRAITLLGLEHHIVTAFTGLVAVDDSGVIGGGGPRPWLDLTPPYTIVGCRTAEADYTVEGVNPEDLSLGVKRPLVVEEFTEPSRSSNWGPRARVTFGRPVTPKGVRVAKLRKPAQAVRYRLRACYETSSEYERFSRYHYRVELEWTPTGVEVRIRGAESRALAACLEGELRNADWPDLALWTTASFTLRLSGQ